MFRERSISGLPETGKGACLKKENCWVKVGIGNRRGFMPVTERLSKGNS
jgi:hypothetical protein